MNENTHIHTFRSLRRDMPDRRAAVAPAGTDDMYGRQNLAQPLIRRPAVVSRGIFRPGVPAILGIATCVTVACVKWAPALLPTTSIITSFASPVSNARKPVRVLVTGFGAFGNVTANPAERVAQQLNGSCVEDEICFIGRVLPVTREGAMELASELEIVPIEGSAEYDSIIHLGVEVVATGIRLEIAAANVLATNRSGIWSASVPCSKSLAPNRSFADIVEGGPCLLATTAPLDRVSLVHV